MGSKAKSGGARLTMQQPQEQNYYRATGPLTQGYDQPVAPPAAPEPQNYYRATGPLTQGYDQPVGQQNYYRATGPLSQGYDQPVQPNYGAPQNVAQQAAANGYDANTVNTYAQMYGSPIGAPQLPGTRLNIDAPAYTPMWSPNGRRFRG